MTESYDADIALVGYGPTGVIAALTPARHGVSAVVLERDKDIYPRARAVTVNDWTMRIFQPSASTNGSRRRSTPSGPYAG